MKYLKSISTKAIICYLLLSIVACDSRDCKQYKMTMKDGSVVHGWVIRPEEGAVRVYENQSGVGYVIPSDTYTKIEYIGCNYR